MTHDLLMDVCVLDDVVRAPCSVRGSVGGEVKLRLDEGHCGVLQAELGASGERVVDPVHTEGLEEHIRQPYVLTNNIADRTSKEDSGWKLSTVLSALTVRTCVVVCFKLPTNGAAAAVVAHTTARKTDRKKLVENFIADSRYSRGGWV